MLSEDEITALVGTEKVISFVHEAKRRGKPCGCLHQKFVIDERHGTVRCRECDEPVSAFHALCSIAKDEGFFRTRVAGMKAEYEKMKAYKPWLKAVREIERLWRGRRMLPTCKHCKRGLYPDELTTISVGIEYEEARRKRGQ